MLPWTQDAPSTNMRAAFLIALLFCAYLAPAQLGDIIKRAHEALNQHSTGMGERVDELKVGMNRAAEKATPEAKKIFIAAVKKMSFDAPRKILTGSNTA